MALPSGWLEVDTGISIEEIVLANMVIDGGGASNGGLFGGVAWFDAAGWYFQNEWNGSDLEFVVYPGSGTPGPFVIDTQTAPVPSPLLDDTDPITYWGDVTLTKTVAGLTLGVTIETDANLDRTLRYALFADSSTTHTVSAAGETRVTNPWSSVTDVTDSLRLDVQWVGPNDDTWTVLEGLGSTYRSNPFPYYRFSGLVANTDPVDYSDGPFPRESGYISPYLTDVDSNPFQRQFTFLFGPPWVVSADADVDDAAGISPGADVELRAGSNTVLAPGTLIATITTPGSGTYALRDVSWISTSLPAGRFRVDLQAAWMAAQSPVIPVSETPVPFQSMLPLTPEGVPEVWQPATVTLAASVSVLHSANAWAEHSGDVDVSGAGGKDWAVNAAGSAVRRALLSKWRDWSNPGHPDFRADGFKIMRWNYVASPTQDAWSWGSYAYLDVAIDAPAAGSVNLVVEAVTANFTFATGNYLAQNQYTVTYTVPVTAGLHTVRVDLMFPNEGGPFYHGRIDAIRFEGLAAGDWTLESLALVTDEDAYLKIDYASTVGIWAAVDGAAPMMLWGVNPFLAAGGRAKRNEDYPEDTSEFFALGGAVPYVNISGTGSVSTRTLSEMLEDLNRIEGFTVTIDESAIDDNLTDGTNTISTVREARWVHPHHPALRPTPGVGQMLDASPRLRYLQIPPGVGSTGTPFFRLYARKIIGGTLEALATTPAGARAAGGRSVKAARVDTGATVATGTTDPGGYVVIAVPTDGTRVYRLEGG